MLDIGIRPLTPTLLIQFNRGEWTNTTSIAVFSSRDNGACKYCYTIRTVIANVGS